MVEQAANEVEEDVVELQLDLDDLDIVAGGAPKDDIVIHNCNKCQIGRSR
ncbi:hypothetical protein [Sorangium sp. So ce542]